MSKKGKRKPVKRSGRRKTAPFSLFTKKGTVKKQFRPFVKKDGTPDRRFSFWKNVKKDGSIKKGKESQFKESFQLAAKKQAVKSSTKAISGKKGRRVKSKGSKGETVLNSILAPIVGSSGLIREMVSFAENFNGENDLFILFEGKKEKTTIETVLALLDAIDNDYYSEKNKDFFKKEKVSPFLLYAAEITVTLDKNGKVKEKQWVWFYEQSQAMGFDYDEFDFNFYYLNIAQ